MVGTAYHSLDVPALSRQDCSLCDRVTNRRSYLSTKPGQLHHLITQHVNYDDSLLDKHQRQDRTRLRNDARALGFQLVPEAA